MSLPILCEIFDASGKTVYRSDGIWSKADRRGQALQLAFEYLEMMENNGQAGVPADIALVRIFDEGWRKEHIFSRDDLIEGLEKGLLNPVPDTKEMVAKALSYDLAADRPATDLTAPVNVAQLG